MVEFLSDLRKRSSFDRKFCSESLRSVRISFVETRNTLLKLDESLTTIHLLVFLNSVLIIMVHIYLIILGNERTQGYSTSLIFTSLLAVTAITSFCLIHGMVYEEADRLSMAFDNLDISQTDLDGNAFRELIYLKSSLSQSKFGFTIGGVVPFKKITLFSVSLYYYFNDFQTILRQKSSIDCVFYSQLYGYSRPKFEILT